MMKTTKITFGLFTGGFLLFSIYKFFSQKHISKETISKIIRKISNLSIHFMFQRYDSQNKISNQKKEKEQNESNSDDKELMLAPKDSKNNGFDEINDEDEI